MATYTWSAFNLSDALSGILVGVPTTPPAQGQTTTENIDDISRVAGNLLSGQDGKTQYKVVINGKTAYLDQDGKVVSSIPSSAYATNTQMYLVTTAIVETIGSDVTRTRGQETGYSQTVDLTNMEPRDNFAIQILSAMLVHTKEPVSFDDGNITLYTRAAYRWAQSMLQSAADARHGQSTTPSTSVNVNTNDLQSNVEKLLYNMSKSFEQGVVVKGSDALGAEPVHTKVTYLPQVVVSDLNTIATAFSIPAVGSSISIAATIYQTKYVRLEIQTYMAYSDISVYLIVVTNDGNREIGYIIPKGSVVSIVTLDDDVTSITSISSKSIRGWGQNDPNTYVFT